MTSSSTASSISPEAVFQALPIRERIGSVIDNMLASLPDPEQLSGDQQRRMIARYASVLEGNFIYWMTATLLSVESEKARSIIIENLTEEVRDCHPGMMRRFAIAAHAVPSDADAMSVYRELTNVRLFLARLLGVPNLVTMAFFEGFIQRFMGYLADLAQRQGSSEMEYTEVHGVCDITHTEELFRALAAEMSRSTAYSDADLFEGVDLLRALLQSVIHGAARAAVESGGAELH